MRSSLDRWDAEGGAPAGDQPGVSESERRVLERLGAAVVSEWAALPTDVQRRLFRQATAADVDAASVKAGIARFLHKNLSHSH